MQKPKLLDLSCKHSNHFFNQHLPVGDMVNEMLFEHEAPSLDDVEQGLFERFGVNPEPLVKHLDRLNVLGLLIDLLVGVNLLTIIKGYSIGLIKV